jgi:hypothetical protein
VEDTKTLSPKEFAQLKGITTQAVGYLRQTQAITTTKNKGRVSILMDTKTTSYKPVRRKGIRE